MLEFTDPNLMIRLMRIDFSQIRRVKRNRKKKTSNRQKHMSGKGTVY